MTALIHAYIWIFALSPLVIRGFNVDTTSPVIHVGPTDSLFGFSVSVHQTQGTNWLLVGAPKAQTDQLNVVEGGAIYKCPSSAESTLECQRIPFDNDQGQPEQNFGRSHQWLGASLKSTGKNGIIAACAPRYVSYVPDVERWEPMGTCFISKNDFTEFEEFSPCRDRGFGWDKVGFCQAGISADITKNKRHLVVGAIGSYYNQGQVYVKGLSGNIQQYSTPEGPPTTDDNYLGYSVAVGGFNYNDGDEDFVVGVPRSNDLKGMVKVFDSRLLLLHELLGDQLGSYFGFAVAVEDVNNDRFDDIIVGAPFFTDRSGTSEKWEAGRVYIYYQDANNNFSEPDKLTGVQSRARFGSSLATLKDINQDGYKDIAIGAPYGGDDERGAVYIYHGSSKGIKKQPAQIIKASDISHNLRTFGSSLSGGLDMDNNRYTDILVGAYESDQVVLLRSKPVVNMDVSIKFTPAFIDLEDKRCEENNVPVACFDLMLCFSYAGKHVPASIDVEFIISLDTLKFHPKRAYFQETGTQDDRIVVTIHKKKKQVCREAYKVVLKSDIRDKYSPIAVDVSYKLIEQGIVDGKLPPVTNQQFTSVIRKQAHILNDCGDEKICVPDLAVKAEMSGPVYIGSEDTITLEVGVTNDGEDAFESQVIIQLPPGFHYVRVEKRDPDSTVGCIDIENGIGLVKCDCGNPLRARHTVEFGLALSTIQFNSSDGSLEIFLSANSSNPEDDSTMNNNTYMVVVPVKVEAAISFTGVSVPEQVTFKSRSKSNRVISHENDIGPEIIHLYEVRNLGPSSIDGADIQIFWPAYTPRDNHLLYLLDVNLQGGLPCELIGLNPENIQVDEDKMSFRTNLTNGIINGRQLRKRRDSIEEVSKLDMDCRAARCVRIECPLDFILRSGDTALVEIRSRLWKDTLLKGGYDETEITSTGHVQITSMPYHIPPDAYYGADVQVTTVANSERPQPGILPVPIWVLVVSIAAGFLLLILVVIGLWQAGFFKRKRVEDKYTAQNSVNDRMSTYSGSPAFASLSTAESDVKSSRSNSNY